MKGKKIICLGGLQANLIKYVMHYLWLAKTGDDTIFIITLVVVLLVVIGYLVLGRDDTIRLEEQDQKGAMKDPEFQKNLLERIDRTNDLLTSIRNGTLLLIVVIVVIPLFFLLFSKGCNSSQNVPSTQTKNRLNTAI